MTQRQSNAGPPTAMTVAGSDSGAGAGIQADLKTFAALGVYGTSAITAITAQNTLRVTAVQELPPEMVTAQIDAVMADIGADAVKTGMLASSIIIETVAASVREHRMDRLVVDPVMVAKGGDRLLREDAVEALKSQLIPLALVVTPNIPEAQVLLGRRIASVAEAREAAREIVRGPGRTLRGGEGWPPGGAGRGRLLRRTRLPRGDGASAADDQHPRHGLHVRLGHCRAPGTGADASGGGAAGQALRHACAASRGPHRPRARAAAPLLPPGEAGGA